MTNSRTEVSSNCRFWAPHPGTGRRQGDCGNPRFQEMVECDSPEHSEHSEQPDRYPRNGYWTMSTFGCRLFQRK